MLLKKFIKKKIQQIVRQELEDIFHKDGDVAVDHHLMQDSWAVVKLDTGTHSCYLKFIDLGKADLRAIEQFLSQFDRRYIDSTPQIEAQYNQRSKHYLD